MANVGRNPKIQIPSSRENPIFNNPTRAAFAYHSHSASSRSYRKLVILQIMPVPETTSAKAFERYVGGKCLRIGQGKAWRDIKAWIIAVPHKADLVPLPSVSEPFLAWTVSGEVDFQER